MTIFGTVFVWVVIGVVLVKAPEITTGKFIALCVLAGLSILFMWVGKEVEVRGPWKSKGVVRLQEKEEEPGPKGGPRGLQ